MRQCREGMVLSFERGGLFFAFNFHPTQSHTNFKLGVRVPGKYHIVLDTDRPEFGGQGRQDLTVEHFTQPEEADGQKQSFSLYLPSRTAIVLECMDGHQ